MQLHRLRDLQDPVAPELAAARDLLRTTGPLAPSLARMQRVRQALRAHVPAPAPVGTSLLVKATLLLLAAGVTAGLFFLTQGSRKPRSEPPARRPAVSVSSTAVVTASPAPSAPPAAEPLRAPPAVPLIHLDAQDYHRPNAAGQRQVAAAASPARPDAVAESALPARPDAVAASASLARPDAVAGVAPPARADAVAGVTPSARPDTPPARSDAVAAVALLARPADVAAVAPPAKVEVTARPSAPAVEIPEEVDPAEASLVLAATQVLRQRGEPARALTLLGEYQRRFPQGALQEEALALNLECLIALSDQRAGPQAREYLKRYPTGRFRAFAAATAARYPASPPLKE